jgi:tetratricopeptide (TPR) repeat protein
MLRIMLLSKSLSLILVGVALLAHPAWVAAQTSSDVPRPEYFIARDLFEAGRVVESSDGFRLASTRSLRVAEQPWIDSIPPLVLLGECYYAQGKLALAMESYDQALMIALAFPSWLDQIQATSELVPLPEQSGKATNWFPVAAKIQTLSYPEPAALNVDLPGGQAALGPVATVTRVDAAEVLRTMAIAVRRRGEILGPLAKHSPLAQPLAQMFQTRGKQRPGWMNHAWVVLRGLHAVAIGSGADAAALLRESSHLNNMHYFMTPFALHALANLEISSGRLGASVPLLQQATLSAAQMDQYSQLAELLQVFAGVCTAGNRIDMLPGLQAAATWGNKRSASIQVFGFAGAAELAASAGNLSAADTLCKQGAAALRSASIPRAQAQLAFANAALAYAENRSAAGAQHLESALTIMHGSAKDGAAVAPVFQAQMVLDLLQADALTVADAEDTLTEILQEPGLQQWQTAPLETIATMTTSAVPFYALWLQLAERRGTNDQVVARMDRLQRERFYESLPLGGRLFSWRQAVLNQSQQPGEVRQLVEQTLQNSPTLASNTQQLMGLTKQLRQMPGPLDERQPSVDAKKRFADFVKAAELQESQLIYQSLQRKPLPRFVPYAASVEELQATIDADDILLSWVETDEVLYGAAITKNAVETWSTNDVDLIQMQLTTLLSDLGLSATVRPQNPMDAVDPKAAWRTSIAGLSPQLIPDNVQHLIAGADRIFVVPDGRLWYLPFELLPDVITGESWLTKHAVSYLPTLGSLPLAYRPSAAVDRTVLITGQFFAADKSSNESILNALVQGLPKAQKVDLAVKNNIPSPMWLRLDIDQLLVCSKIEAASRPWETNLLQLDASRNSQVGSWMESPGQVPAIMLLPGFQSTAASGSLGDGRELSLPACGLLYSGARSALVSRWPVAGRSSQVVLSRYMQELDFVSPSVAWQRAALALWAEELLVAEEPAMLPAAKDAPTLMMGKHPKIWSSYMILGDTGVPQAESP